MESLIIEQPNTNIIKSYKVENYDEQCEEHFKIRNIIPLKKTTKTIVIDILVHIFTLCIIEFVYGWFPLTEKFIRYEESTLDEAIILGIYCTDNQFYFVELKKLQLPQISNEKLQNSELCFNTKTFVFTFKLFSYILNPKTRTFNYVKFSVKGRNEEIFESFSKGLTNDELNYQKQIYGECNMNFKINSFFRTLFLNTCNFFFFFQVYSIILWLLTEYYYYSALIFLMTIYSLIEETIITRNNLFKIRNMAKYSININVLRNNSSNQKEEQSETLISSNGLSQTSSFNLKNIILTKTTSDDLVPGDIFALPENGVALPCDCVLLSGSVIINESMLTGESTPIIKTHLPSNDSPFDEEDNSKYFLYAGTKIVQKRGGTCLALCYSTGFNTVKGTLVRSILFPKEFSTKFKEDSNKYLVFMFILCVAAFILVLPFKLNVDEPDYWDILLQCLDLITTAVPPALPCCLEIGTSIAQERIQKNGVFCINRERINFAGKLNVCVFDKTGTLTEDHLSIAGFIPVKVNKTKNNSIFSSFLSSVNELSEITYKNYKSNKKLTQSEILLQRYIECLASCQSVTKVNGEIIGDPIDVGMFNCSNWKLEEEVNDLIYKDKFGVDINTFIRPSSEPQFSSAQNSENHYELGLVKRFEFSSKLQRMSVLAKNAKDNYLICFCKGSPEKIVELCKKESVPEDFNEVLNKYTSKGLRVLGMGYKLINYEPKSAQNLSRTNCEKNLSFLGLLIVKNKVKEATAPTLKVLGEEVNMRLKMATGDNILTAYSVARDSNLIPKGTSVYSCEIEEINDDKELTKSFKKRLVWKPIETHEEDEQKNENISLENSDVISLDDDMEDDFKEEISDIDDIINTNEISVNENYESGDNSILNKIKEGNKAIKKEEDEEDLEIEDMMLDVDLNNLPFSQADPNAQIAFAMTGSTFEILYKLNKKYLSMKKNKTKSNNPRKSNRKSKMTKELHNFLMEMDVKGHWNTFHQAFRLVLKYASVFARCSPENKAQIITSLQDENMLVLMCGDGANDCSALKAADVGISLSPEEASMAAPFTSQTPDISCIINVLREGKCAMETSIQTFKYMILYSIIQFISVTGCMLCDSLLSDWQYMASDIAVISPLAFLIPLTEAYEKLTYHQPVTALICFPVVTSIFMQTFTMLIFQVGSYYLADYFFPKEINGEDYTKINSRICSSEFEDEEGEILNCIDNTTFFFISFAQYLISAAVFCTSRPFKKPIYTNILLLIFLILAAIYGEYIIFYSYDWVSENLIYLIPYPDDSLVLGEEAQEPLFLFSFKFYIMIITVINFIICYVLEKIVLIKLKKYWERRRILQIRKEMIDNKEISLYLINKERNYSIIEKLHPEEL